MSLRSLQIHSTLLFFLTLVLSVKARDPSVYGFLVRDLYSNTQPEFDDEISRWQAGGLMTANTPKTYLCNTVYYLGGPNILAYNGYFERTYTGLPAHDIVYFVIKFIILDTWTATDLFELELGGVTMAGNWVLTQSRIQNYCGGSAKDIDVFRPVGKVFHADSSITMRVTSKMAASSSTGSFGIRAINLQFTNQTAGEVQSSCAATELSSINTGSFGCQCDDLEYLDSSGHCQSCDSSCRECFGAGPDHCIGCAVGYSYDGTSCIQCAASCDMCIGTTSSDCLSCPTGHYHYWDNTCKSSCSTTLYDISGTYDLECRPKCYAANTFTLWDMTCSATCDLPLKQRIQGDVKFCDYPCTDPTKYLYPDGTCGPACTLPYISAPFMGKNICKFKCSDPTPYYYPSDTGCQSACNSPFTATTEAPGKFCRSSCTNGNDFLYWNGTCAATCPTDWLTQTIAAVKLCFYSCGDTSKFLQKYDGTCKATCTSPMITSYIGSNKYCDLPCPPNKIYSQSSQQCLDSCDTPFTLSIAPEGYKICSSPCQNAGNYYYETEKACLPGCEDPYYVETRQSVNFCQIELSTEEIKQIQQLNQISEGGRTASSIGSIVAAVLSCGDPGALGVASLVKMLQYMKYLDLGYPVKLALTLKLQKVVPVGITFAPKIDPEFAGKFTNHSLPEKFEKAGLHSSLFVNLWPLILTLSFILGGILIVHIFVYLASRSLKTRSSIQKLNVIVKWNFFLTIFCSNYGDIGFFTALEISTLSFDSFFAVLSFAACIGLNGLALFVIVRAIQINSILQNVMKRSTETTRVRKTQCAQKKWENYKMLFEGFCQYSILQQMFTVGFLIRSYSINMIVGFFSHHPLALTIALTAMSGGMLFYLLLKMPMTKTLNNLQQLILEIAILIINICLLILGILDSIESEATHSRETIGEVIIWTNIAISIVSNVFLILKVIMIAREFYKARKAAKLAQQRSITQLSTRRLSQRQNLRLVPPRLSEPCQALKSPQPLQRASVRGSVRAIDREIYFPRLSTTMDSSCEGLRKTSTHS